MGGYLLARSLVGGSCRFVDCQWVCDLGCCRDLSVTVTRLPVVEVKAESRRVLSGRSVESDEAWGTLGRLKLFGLRRHVGSVDIFRVEMPSE
jgi:hypothetical protein